MLLLGLLEPVGGLLARRALGAPPEEVAPITAGVDRGAGPPEPVREPVVARLVGAAEQTPVAPAEAPRHPSPAPLLR